MTMTEAASLGGVSVKTVQRAVASGRLTWHGPRRGRHAAGLVSSDVLACFRKTPENGAEHDAPLFGHVRRAENVPHHIQVVRNIERASGDWRIVFGAIEGLIEQGEHADLDVIATLFGLLRDERSLQLRMFCDVLHGRVQVSYGFVGATVSMLVDAVKSALLEIEPIDESRSPAEVWSKMMKRLLAPNPPQSRARPMFGMAVDPKTKTMRMSLSMETVWDELPGQSRMTWNIGEGEYFDAIRREGWSRLSRTEKARAKKAFATIESQFAECPPQFLPDVWSAVATYMNGESIEVCAKELAKLSDDARLEYERYRMGIIRPAMFLRAARMAMMPEVEQEKRQGGRDEDGESTHMPELPSARYTFDDYEDDDDNVVAVLSESVARQTASAGHRTGMQGASGTIYRSTRLSKSMVALVMGTSRMAVWRAEQS